MSANPDKLNELIMKFVTDLGASATGPNILIGDQLGLYKAISAYGPITPNKLAEKTGTNERYVREWCAGQAASGYINYDPSSGNFLMSPEQTFALTNENNPLFVPGAFYIVSAMYKDERKLADAFRSGNGFGWGEHQVDLFSGTKKFFKPNYIGSLDQLVASQLGRGRAKITGRCKSC